MNTLGRSRKQGGASQQLVSVSQELHKILEWVSKNEKVLEDVVSKQVDNVLKVREGEKEGMGEGERRGKLIFIFIYLFF